MTAATAGGLTRPPLKLELTLEDGSTKEIKMSYGLFNDIQRAIPEPTMMVDVIASDPFTRDYLIRRCMTDTKKMVKEPDTELIAVEDCGLDDPDEIEKLLNWVAGHILYFFATSAGKLKVLGEAFKGTLTTAADQPAPSTTGSPS